MKQDLTKIHHHIVEGRLDVARAMLSVICRRRVKREDLGTLASLARRASLAPLGLRLLHSIINPARARGAPATPRELSEYAACLIRVGAVDEGLLMLRGLDAEKQPQVLIFQTLAAVSRWDYQASIAPLRKFLGFSNISDYDRIVAQVNLAAALVHQKEYEAGDRLLDELLSVTRHRELGLLLANTHQVKAESLMARQQWAEAEAILRQSVELLGDRPGVHSLILRKLQAMLVVARNGCTEQTLSSLEGVRHEAASWPHWETIRDCDRFEAIQRHDPEVALKLYFGTPFASFRDRLMEDFGGLSIPNEFAWSEGKREHASVCLATGKAIINGESFGTSPLIREVLLSLSSDRYRPLRVATMHGMIYPNQCFNPFSSPAKIHEIVRRSRLWVEEHKLPLDIVHQEEGYRLRLHNGCTLRVTAHRSGETFPHEPRLVELAANCPTGPFSAKDAMSILDVSLRTTLRILKQGLERGVLLQEGTGAQTRYRRRA